MNSVIEHTNIEHPYILKGRIFDGPFDLNCSVGLEETDPR